MGTPVTTKGFPGTMATEQSVDWVPHVSDHSNVVPVRDDGAAVFVVPKLVSFVTAQPSWRSASIGRRDTGKRIQKNCLNLVPVVMTAKPSSWFRSSGLSWSEALVAERLRGGAIVAPGRPPARSGRQSVTWQLMFDRRCTWLWR
jgi:hypothetical protein